MGDEIGLVNDPGWADDPERAGDSRWMHRPAMDWDAAARRRDPRSVEGRLFGGLTRILEARRRTPQLRARFDTDVVDAGHPSVFCVAHRHPLGDLFGIYNFTEGVQYLRVAPLEAAGLAGTHDALVERPLPVVDGHLVLAPTRAPGSRAAPEQQVLRRQQRPRP